MFFKFWSYVLGYVLIRVEGVALEKFVNMTISRGIYLWDITLEGDDKLLIKVRVQSFKYLRHIAKKVGCRISIQEKSGLPFIWAYFLKRKMLLVGGVTFFLTLYLMSSFVWFVEIEGTKEISSQRIYQSLEEAGLEKGTPKWEIDTKAIERKLGQDIPELAWVGVRIKGTKAVVEVVEKKIPKVDKDSKKPAHIVATKKGVIKEILVMTGEAAVKEGQLVRKGQVLISGIVMPEESLIIKEETEEKAEGEPEEVPLPKHVHAMGIVKARIWYETIGEVEIVQTKYKRTGKSIENLRIKIAGKEIILKGPKEITWKHYEKEEKANSLAIWRNIKFPVEVISTSYFETEEIKHDLGYNGAKELAISAAEDNIKKRMGKDAEIVTKEIEELKSDSSKVRFKVTVETIEDIGEERYINEK